MNLAKTLKTLNILRKECTSHSFIEWCRRSNLETSTVYRWINRETNPNWASLERLAKALGVELEIKISSPTNPDK